MPGIYERIFRTLLFQLSAEHAHALAQRGFRSATVGRVLGAAGRRSADGPEIDLGGVPVRNPIGLSAGFDKDASLLPGLAPLGFGFLTVGSVTRDHRDGNPRPRLVRYPDEVSIGNSMGLPGPGAAAVAARLAGGRPRSGPPLFLSVAGFGVEEMVDACRAVAPHADAVELGLICPNSVKTEPMGEARMLDELLESLGDIGRPIFVKLPPYPRDDRDEAGRSRERVAVCLDRGVAGLTIGATRTRQQHGLALGHGSLAGGPNLPDALRMVEDVTRRTAGTVAVKASGGVQTGADVARLLDAGADAVEVYTAFVYRGPRVAYHLRAELADLRRARERG